MYSFGWVASEDSRANSRVSSAIPRISLERNSASNSPIHPPAALRLLNVPMRRFASNLQYTLFVDWNPIFRNEAVALGYRLESPSPLDKGYTRPPPNCNSR